METVALLGGILIAIVFVAERLAFAVIVYMLSRWAYRAGVSVLRTFEPEWRTVRGWIARAIHTVRHWWTMRALHSQIAGGATP